MRNTKSATQVHDDSSLAGSKGILRTVIFAAFAISCASNGQTDSGIALVDSGFALRLRVPDQVDTSKLIISPSEILLQSCQEAADAGFVYRLQAIHPAERAPEMEFAGPASRYSTSCGLTLDSLDQPLALLRGLSSQRFDFQYVVVLADGGTTDLGTCLNSQRPPTMQALRVGELVIVGLHGNRCPYDCGEPMVALDPMSFFAINPATGRTTPYCLTDAGPDRTKLSMSADSPSALFLIGQEWHFLDFRNEGIDLSQRAPTNDVLIPVAGVPLWPRMSRALVHKETDDRTLMFLERLGSGEVTLRDATEINGLLARVLAIAPVDDRFVIVTGQPKDAGVAERAYLLFEDDVLVAQVPAERARLPLNHTYEGKFLSLLTERTDAGTFLNLKEIDFGR